MSYALFLSFKWEHFGVAELSIGQACTTAKRSQDSFSQAEGHSSNAEQALHKVCQQMLALWAQEGACGDAKAV